MKGFDELYAEIEEKAKGTMIRNVFSDMSKTGNEKLILYGAGGNCESAFFLCAYMNTKVKCICDSYAEGTVLFRNEVYDIISPEQLVSNEKDAYVLITSWKYENEIYEALLEKGFPKDNIYFLRCPWSVSVEEFREKYFGGYRWVYDFLEDEGSKQKVIDRIKLLLLGLPCSPDSEYKDGYFGYSGLLLDENETYVDGGGYIGDSAEEFIINARKNGRQYRHIYSFEPDREICKTAETNLQQYENVEMVSAGLWNKTTQLQFFMKQESMASGFCEEAGGKSIFVPVVSLDEFFEGKDETEWPTTIKLDIEGSEKEALLGAAKVIQTKKPKLVICVYHKPEDIYELIQVILDICPDYSFKLWQIGESFFDMILYAI